MSATLTDKNTRMIDRHSHIKLWETPTKLGQIMNTGTNVIETKTTKTATKRTATKKRAAGKLAKTTAKKSTVKIATVAPKTDEPKKPHPLMESPERFKFSIINYNDRYAEPMLDVTFGQWELGFFMDNAINTANRTGGYQFILIDETETAPRKRYTKRYCAKFHAQTFTALYAETHDDDDDTTGGDDTDA